MKKVSFLFFMLLIISNLLVAQTSKSKNAAQDSLKKDKVDMPKFPGGERGLIQYLSQNMVYPKEDIKDSIAGKVVLKFTVGKDGSIIHTEIVKSLSPACDREAIRVVKTMPQWEPATLKGKKIPVIFTLPLVFRPN